MIYVIITTCISNRYGIIDAAQRQERYLHSIRDTLVHVPASMIPILVENNGSRATYLDHFTHHGQAVPVVYTDNNQILCTNKAVNELMDLKEVIRRVGIQDTDMIIKLTGRYRVTSPVFFQTVMEHEKAYDAFLKCYNVCTRMFDPHDAVLGCYAIRCNYLRLWNSASLDVCDSPERHFARFCRGTIRRLREMETLGVECSFADTNLLWQV